MKAFYFALGSYMEQEAKKEDNWRERSLGELYAHLSHEIEEVQGNIRRNELSFLLHNCVDLVSLSTILLAKVMEIAKVMERDNGTT